MSSVWLYYPLGNVTYKSPAGNDTDIAYDEAITDHGPKKTGPESLERNQMPRMPHEKWGKSQRRMAYIESFSNALNEEAASMSKWFNSISLGSGSKTVDRVEINLQQSILSLKWLQGFRAKAQF